MRPSLADRCERTLALHPAVVSSLGLAITSLAAIIPEFGRDHGRVVGGEAAFFALAHTRFNISRRDLLGNRLGFFFESLDLLDGS